MYGNNQDSIFYHGNHNGLIEPIELCRQYWENGRLVLFCSTSIQLFGCSTTNYELSGEIPSTLGDLINLTSFTVYGNDLDGELPIEIGNLFLFRYSTQNFIIQY